jgi:glycosyltransferase involved in cell wall biosynthesis
MVVTLSRTVADRLVGAGRVPAARIMPLFHPDLHYESPSSVRQRMAGDPLRLLFFGRILKYKGLPLLIDAVEKLRAEGVSIQLGVAGAGNIRHERSRLEALRAEIINRWIADREIGPLLARYDAVALSHIEASQSGVAAMAFGHRMPVVAPPVGGLVEQVEDGRTGILAQRPSGASLADAIRRLALDTNLYNSMSHNLATTADGRSMRRFVAQLADVIHGGPAGVTQTAVPPSATHCA